MNRTFLTFLIIAIVLMISVIGKDDVDYTADTMPWNVQILENNTSRVFGITLGKSSIQDAHQILGRFSETRLFTINDQLELRAHFDELNLGGLLAELDLIYQLSTQELSDLKQQASDTEHGDYLLLNDKLLMKLLSTPVKQVVYTPLIDYDEDLIAQRFGEAADHNPINNTTDKLHYPELGLEIYLDSAGKERFVYSLSQRDSSTED